MTTKIKQKLIFLEVFDGVGLVGLGGLGLGSRAGGHRRQARLLERLAYELRGLRELSATTLEEEAVAAAAAIATSFNVFRLSLCQRRHARWRDAAVWAAKRIEFADP